MPCEASGSESLRFLLGDVVKVKALFPCGNKAPRQKGVKEEEDKGGLAVPRIFEDENIKVC